MLPCSVENDKSNINVSGMRPFIYCSRNETDICCIQRENEGEPNVNKRLAYKTLWPKNDQ